MKSLHHRFFLFLFAFLLGGIAFGQRSKHGAKVIVAANTVVNEYTDLSANAAAGATQIKVTASSLNSNSRFSGNLAPGDLIMIIQVQGATILGGPDPGNPTIATPADSSWGGIQTYNNCGNWEFQEVLSVPDNITIDISCPLKNSYTGTGKTVVVRVPRYSTLTVNAATSITCDPWNGTIGGICAIEVEFNTTINATGSIDVSGKGFRGPQPNADFTNWGIPWISASTSFHDGGEKGEGIAGYQGVYDGFGGRYCKASPANGGGGGNAQNAGGGGGANGGNPASWNGVGVPDISVAGYANAWNLEFAGLAALSSSGGGKGGYTFSGSNSDPTVNGPNNFGVWGGDWRRSCGGFGGRPLDYSTGKLFLGGGGGSGNANDNSAGAGGNGGGLIYLMNYGLVSGTGSFLANGNAGGNTKNQYKDGAGGGGAGGTIVVNSIGAITGVTLTANGGKGGDQSFTIPTQQAEGPGGGGGGGYIAVSNGTPTMNVTGGNNGTTNSTGVNPEFPPNGATKGGAGTSGAVLLPSVVVNAANVTICTGQAATLNGSLSGNPPAGTTVIWYDALVGGNVLPSTGGTLTTSVITTAGTYTYYVGACPGTYHLPVTVTVNNFPAISVSPNTTICSGGNTTLSASGGTTFMWSPAAGLSATNISNPVANPTTTTTYSVDVTTPCGTATGTVTVTVNSSIIASISGNTTVCTGGNTTLTASGGNTFAWNTGASTAAITVSPTANTTYSVTVGSGGCSATASVSVTVASAITASVTASSTTLCPGSTVTLTASGGSNYLWSTSETTAAITVSPTATGSYSVDVSSGSCASTASITLTVANNFTTSITGPSNICAGGNATLTATGGGNYQWSTSQTTASITVTPSGTTTYSVLTSAGTCTASATHTVNVGANLTASVAGPATICGGASATLSASGGSTYAWNTGASTANITVTPNASTTTNYTVIASSGSCADTATFSLQSLPPLFTYVAGSTQVCQGGSSTLTASMNVSNNNTYLWSTGSTATTVVITPSVTTTYSVTGFSGNCSNTVPYTVTIIPQASATVSPNVTICAGQSTTLSCSGGASYSWSNGSPNSSTVVSPLASQTYTVIAGISSCADTDSVAVTVLPSPTVSITSSNTTVCGGDMVTLNASGGGTYTWSNGSPNSSITVTPVSTATYSVISTSGGCNDTAAVTITVSPPPAASINGNNNICQGQAVTLTATPPGAVYQWSSGETSQSINPSAVGTYSVIVSIGSCKDTASINTVIAPNPTASAFSDTTIISGTNANLTAGGGSFYAWDNGMNGAGITVAPNSTTVYCVTVTDNNGCTDTACVTVKVEECSKVLYLPNAFSPNGDLENDEWQIYYNIPGCIVNFKLVVFNRWGEMVFKTQDPRFTWDGEYKGWFTGREPGATEVYSYYMQAELMDGTRIDRKGNVSLLR